MKETPFISYPGFYCPHWSVDGEKCASCGEEVPFHIRMKNTRIIDKGLYVDGRPIGSQGIKTGDVIGFNKNGFIKLPKLDKLNVTLNLDGDSIDKYTPLTIVLNGEKITLEHEDIKDLFYRQKEQKITKLIDFMRENDFKEKDISGVISNLRSES